MKSMKFFIAFMFFYIHAMAQAPVVSFDPISVSTIAGVNSASVRILGPVDPAGNIYIAQDNRVSRMSPAGTQTVIAGTGVAGYVDGLASSSQFSDIKGLALDAAGNIYVSDRGNYCIRKITPAGVVSTFASNVGGEGIATDVAGNLYAVDGLFIRKITAAGVVSTFAGDGTPPPGGQFFGPQDMAIDQAGNLYVQQAYESLLKITPAGVVSFIRPPGYSGFTIGVTADKAGNIYVSNWVNQTIIIYKIFPGGDAAPLAGSTEGYKDTIGVYAQFSGVVRHLSIDDAGNIYTSDANGVRKLSKPKLNFAGNAGAPSPAKYFAISGNYLNGPANLQAPPGYELSLNEAGPYSPTLSVGSVAGEVKVVNVFIRLTASVPAGVYNDSVVLSTNGAATKKLGVSGTVTNAPKKLVIIGSGTSACIGLNPVSECYVGRLSSAYNKTAPPDTTIDNSLAVGSTNCYNGMPSSYVSPYPAGSGYTPLTNNNITAALALHPDVVLVNYPTNGYDVLSVNEIMFCLRTIRDSSNKKGVPCYITTTQPRTSPASFNTSAMKLKLAVLKDSILAAFGPFAIDFWTGLINPADSSVLYDQGDHTNMNPAGHNILFQRVLAKNVFAPVATGGGTGLQGVYYNGTAFAGSPLLTRIDPTINFELTYSHPPLSPAPGIVPEDNYSVRWTGKVQPLFSEAYTFYTLSDDGIRLWVNGVQLVNNFVNQGATEKSGSVTLVAGQKYDIVIEYYEATGEAITKLSWSSASTAKAIVPQSQLFPPGASNPVPACATNSYPANGTTFSTRNAITLIWGIVNNATLYDVYFWTGATAPSTPTASNVIGTSYDATGLTASTLYNWYVVPKNASGAATGCAANATTFTIDGPGVAPACVINSFPISGSTLLTQTTARLVWPASSSATSYDVYLAAGNAVPTVLLANTTALTYYAINLIPGTLYSWYIAPRNAAGANTTCGAGYKYTFTTAVATVGFNLAPVANTGGINSIIVQPTSSVTLDGSASYDPDGHIVQYYWYQLEGPAAASISNFSAFPVVSGLTMVGKYVFGLQVKDDNSTNGYATATVTVIPIIPACAINTMPVNGSTITTTTSAILQWGGVANASSYDVYWWTGPTAPATPTVNVTTTAYNATGLTASALYNWYVVPKNAGGAAIGCANNKTTFTTAAVPNTPVNGLQGDYYTGTGILSGPIVLTRIDPTINMLLTYSTVLSPAPGLIPNDNFSIRWTGQVKAEFTETYTFYTLADDGIRLWVNGVQLVDNWTLQGPTEKSGTINLVAGQKYDIKIEYFEWSGESTAKLSWSSPNTAKAIVPKSQLYPPASSVRIMDNSTALQAMPSLETASAFAYNTASISPNPVKRGQPARLQINSSKTGETVIKVMGSNGHRISNQTVNLVRGINTTSINTNALAQGLYLISITGGNKPLTMKLIVQ